MNGSAIAYFFKGSHYVRYDIANDTTIGPTKISDKWPALPSDFQLGFDTAVNWGNGIAYFFKGINYVEYNIALDTAIGPTAISDPLHGWPALPTTPINFQSDIKSAINWGNGIAYFFKGSHYVRYDIAHNTTIGPTAISDKWPALPTTPINFQLGFDSAINWGNGIAYFFKGSNYVRYDIANDTTIGPTAISDNWPALATTPINFQFDIKSAINWTFPLNVAHLMRAAGLNVVEEGDWKARNRGKLTPVGIIHHHSAGNGQPDLNVVINGRGPSPAEPNGLPGPLADFYVGRDGRIHIVSDGLANHAGNGVPSVLDNVQNGVAPAGSAAELGLHTVPGFSGNKLFFGFENENLGDGIQPWPNIQIGVMAVASAALCRVHGWNENQVIGHLEWTERKIDPKGFKMSDFRKQVGSVLDF